MTYRNNGDSSHLEKGEENCSLRRDYMSFEFKAHAALVLEMSPWSIRGRSPDTALSNASTVPYHQIPNFTAVNFHIVAIPLTSTS
jgi:hypothetical protein